MDAALQTPSRKLVVELRNVKYSASLSQETAAFTATVYFDGKRVGTARNHGTGGPNDIFFDEKKNYEVFREFLAAEPPEFHEGYKLDMTGDLFIGLLLERHLKEKDQKKYEKGFQALAARARLSGRVALIVSFEGGHVSTACKPEEVESMTADLLKKHAKGAAAKTRVIV